MPLNNEQIIIDICRQEAVQKAILKVYSVIDNGDWLITTKGAIKKYDPNGCNMIETPAPLSYDPAHCCAQIDRVLMVALTKKCIREGALAIGGCIENFETLEDEFDYWKKRTVADINLGIIRPLKKNFLNQSPLILKFLWLEELCGEKSPPQRCWRL